MISKKITKEKKYKTTLYRVVFESIFVKYSVFVLFAFLLLQPVAPALAFLDVEIPVSIDTQIATPTAVDQPPVAQDEQPGIAAEVGEQIDDALTSKSEDIQFPIAISDSAIATTVVQATSVNEILVSENETNTTQSSTAEDSESDILSLATSSASTTSVEEEPSIFGVVDTSISTSTNVLTPTEIMSTASEVLATSSTLLDTVAVTEHNSHAFEFDTKECAVVGGGAYYCSTPKESVDLTKDGVFAAQDSGGDLEIYVRVGGKENIITDNTVDDSAPYYDSLSNRIVWHRLVHDRYQIVSYDMKNNTETYLTDTQYNNMEPMAYGEITLWQAWIDNNWEILLNDGISTKQLTYSAEQDVSPHMRGGYIVWQTQFQDGWQVAVYDQKTNRVEYIASEGGLKVENPRFVLVYDSTNDKGDIQTVGYDFDTKSTFALGSLPAELPDKLPDPDQTGETRALIQAKQTSREGESEAIIVPQDTGSPTPNATTSATSSPVRTLDLSQGTTTASTSIQAGGIGSSVVDVVIPSYASSTPISQDVLVIPDIVIPPYYATTTE